MIDVTPLQKQRAELDLSILLDDSLESTVSQLAEVADFIRALPPTTQVAVAYIRNPTFVMGQDLTTDRELAVKALQIPLGSPRQFDSPYLALTDLIEAMPENGHRRAVLIISDGEDRFRGPFEPVSPVRRPDCVGGTANARSYDPSSTARGLLGKREPDSPYPRSLSR